MMQKIAVTLLAIALLVGLLSAAGLCWMGNERLEEIDQRILDTERKLLNLDEDQILNRIEWANWGIDILTKDIKEMENEIRQERKRWEELRKADMSSEAAWKEWKKVGRELDESERKKTRLNSVLYRIKKLRNRLKWRLSQVRRLEPKSTVRLFRLGVVAGMFNAGMLDSISVAELQIETPVVDVFFGSRREEYRYPKILYFGIKKRLEIYDSELFALAPLGGIQFISVEDYWRGVSKKDIEFFLGGQAKIKWINARGEKTALSLECRYAFGEKPNLWLGIGLHFLLIL